MKFMAFGVGMFSIGRRKDDKLQFGAWSSTLTFWENKTSYQAGTCLMGARPWAMADWQRRRRAWRERTSARQPHPGLMQVLLELQGASHHDPPQGPRQTDHAFLIAKIRELSPPDVSP